MRNLLDIYLSEITNCIVSPEEESKLINIYQKRLPDWEQAQEKVIKSNLLFVAHSAFEMSNNQHKILELISEGNLSLLESLDKFDSARGCRFLTYASFDIKGRMLKHLAKNNYFSALKISLKNIELASKAKKFIESYRLENNINPSIKEIARYCEIEEPKALLISELAQSKIQSIQILIDFEDNEKLSEIKDENGVTPDYEVNSQQVSSILNNIIFDLTINQRIIINKRFGLNGESETDLATIGKELNLTKERIRQIESSVLKILRKDLEKLGSKSVFI